MLTEARDDKLVATGVKLMHLPTRERQCQRHWVTSLLDLT